MINTLRITSIIAVILAVVLFGFSAVLGVRGDEGRNEILNAPDAIKKFTSAKGAKTRRSGDQVSPIVKQAKAFALYLNPPPKPKKKKALARSKASAIPRPPSTSVKFKLIGTCFYASNPEKSMALIDLPGEGLKWVRQSGEVNHQVFVQITDGLVVVNDGKKSFEVVPVRTPVRSLIRGEGPGPSAPEVKKPALPVSNMPKTRPVTAKSPPKSKVPQISPERNAELMKKLMEQIKTMRDNSQSGIANPQDSAEMMKKFMSELQSERLDSDEAKRLGRLGRRLKQGTVDPNKPLAPSSKIETSSTEPNKPSEQ